MYVVDRYPELSQTFVRDEIAELRRRGVAVTVLGLAVGDTSGDAANVQFLVRRDLVSALPIVLRFMATHPVLFLRAAFRVVRLRGSYWRLFLTAVVPFAHEHTGRVDRVHAHFAWGASGVAAYLGALLAAPVSVTTHARDIFVDAKLLTQKFAFCDVVVTVCEYNERWLRERGLARTPIRVVPCGVELPVLSADSTRSGRVVAVGRLVPKKGFDLLIKAVAALGDKVDGVTVDILGDGPERDRLTRLVEELGLDDVVFLRGATSHPEALAAIGDAQVFVLPCRVDADGDSDAMPVVIREAMASAVPVVSTTVAGIPETVTPRTGWLCEPDDDQALARALLEALQNPEKTRLFGEAARRRVEERFTVQTSIDQLLAAWSPARSG